MKKMRSSIGQQFSIARFRTNKECKLADITGGMDLSNWNSTISFLASKISEPNTGNEEGFYHIKQFYLGV